MTVRSLARQFVYRHLGGTALVLIYHRVAILERDPQLLAVSPEHFEAQMRMLSQTRPVVSLHDLVADLPRHRVRDGAVAVTFDDGYADNHLTAAPILDGLHIPATVFVNSGYVGGTREFWWDELERIVLEPGTLPRHIAIGLGEARFSATLKDSIDYAEQDAARDRGWSMLEGDTNAREHLYRELCGFVMPLSSSEREEALRQLRGQTGIQPVVRATNLQLSAAEVRALDEWETVEVGAHTASHQVLSARTFAEQRAEIVDDRDALADWCARPMRLMSYPYGGLEAYTDETVDLVREAGFEGACANHPGVVKPWTDPYRIPRNLVRDWDADTLAAHIEGWFRDAR